MQVTLDTCVFPFHPVPKYRAGVGPHRPRPQNGPGRNQSFIAFPGHLFPAGFLAEESAEFPVRRKHACDDQAKVPGLAPQIPEEGLRQ